MPVERLSRELIIATQNRHKIREIKEIWSDLGLNFLCLADLPQQISLKETGSTFIQNAEQKALQVARHVDGFVLADDSGLEVEALDGAPGVFSARYAGQGATDIQNNQKLLAALKGVALDKRKARYCCVIAMVDLDKRLYFCEGKCEGVIALEPSGQHGFGYDPLFYVPEYGLTMAQLSPVIKNKISHRAKALQKARKILERLLTPVDVVDF